MLRELHVKNLAVLASASVELGPGLNVLTGETGAGKSIVVDSLLLLSGARASSDLVRSGAESLTVTGVFEPEGEGWRKLLAEAGVEPEGPELMVRREIGREGRNRVYVNDQPATARLLVDLAPFLLRIHGQREEMGLVDPELQRVWLDRSGGAEAREMTGRVAAAYDAWRQVQDRLDRLTGDERARRERLDLLAFQAREIDAAQLTAGEEEELVAERDALRNREEITRALGGAYALLFDDEGAAVERIARSRTLLEAVASWESQAGGWLEELEELQVRLDELARSVHRRLDGLDADPGRLDQVEERLALVERLCRKYAGGTAHILERRRQIEAELEELSADEAGAEELETKAAAALESYRTEALALSEARRRWGAELLERMQAEMKDLGLGKARLELALERPRLEGGPLVVDGVPVEPSPTGVDRVVFLLAANPGEEPRPLAKVASGGELSRLYLALQLAARTADERRQAQPTLVFDEADAGISGAQAAALGKKLQRLAADAQILAVTHLPQVASCADHHFRVAKGIRGERTFTAVEPLDGDERVSEVARLLAGEKVTDLSRSHARELIGGAARSA